MKARAKVKLRRVERADFRRSEYTMFMSLPKTFRRSLKSNEAVCFISGSGNQIVFVYGFTDVGITKPAKGRGQKYGICTSVRLRLTRTTWNPMMLANYARECGIELEGIQFFEERYAHLIEKVAA